MASYIAYIPGPALSLTPETLSSKLTDRGLACHVESADNETWPVFEGSNDVLFTTLKSGSIDYLEHSLGLRGGLSGYIGDALTNVGFEWIDEDDPRWRAAE